MQRRNPGIQAIFSAEESNEPVVEPVAPEPVDDDQMEPMEVDDEPIRRPPRFFGNREHVEAYVSHCKSNFTSYPTKFADEEKKVLYLLNNMGGSAFEWASKLLIRYPVYSQNSELFIARIRNTFGDPDIEYHHQRQFRALRQHGIGNALDYVNDFRRLAVFVPTDENLLIDNFQQGLDPRLQEKLGNIFPPPDTLDDMARLAVRLDRHLLQQINRKNRNNRSNNRNNNNNGYISHNNRNHYRNTSTTRNNQLERCSYCNRVGHSEDNCYRRQNDIRNQQNTNHSTSAATIPRINTIERTNVESPNEPVSTFTISDHGKTMNLDCLIDTGAFSCFLDKTFADNNAIQYNLDPKTTKVHGINGSSQVYGRTKPLAIQYKQYTSTIQFFVINLKGYQGIIGFDWMQENKGRITLDSNDFNLVFLSDPQDELVSYQENSVSEDSNDITDDSIQEELLKEITAEVQEDILPIIRCIENEEIEDEKTACPEIPPELMDVKEVFDEKKPEELPPHRIYDCTIELKPNTTPFYGPLYSLTQEELVALKEYIDDNLKKKFIRPSKSPYGAPVLFVPKKDGPPRLVVDYRRLNKDTIRNSYPLPLIKDLLDRAQGCKYFTKLDLPHAYNLVRIREGDQHKTAFRCRFGHFEYEVMPFGLMNAPATFQFFINDIFSDVLDKFVFSYLDDVLIFSKTKEEHIQHVKTVLNILLENHLYCKLKKCEFFKSSVKFLGYNISADGISMCEDKVEAILNWPTPKSVKEIQQFLGLANFYRRFISNFSKLVQPLTALTKKDTPFLWSKLHSDAFENLKRMFCSAPVLSIPDPYKPFVVETDASNFAIGAVLSQLDEINKLHPCAFMSKGLKNAEVRYNIFDKELLATVSALKEWRSYLQGAKYPFKIYCDHRNLKFPRNPEMLSDRQIRWYEFLSKFDYEIVYRKGVSNKKADILSRRPDLFIGCITTTLDNSYFLLEIVQEYKKDPFLEEIIDNINEGKNFDKNYELINDLLYFKNRIVIPKALRNSIMLRYHSTPSAGHFSTRKTEELISRFYFWPNLHEDVDEFVKQCLECATLKDKPHAPYGLSQISFTPKKPWTHINVDFITDLPPSAGYTIIMSTVDQFSKMTHFIPVQQLPSAEDVANLFMKEIFRLHGLPVAITSDRGSQFTSRFWKKLLELLNIRPIYSTAHHHASNGQVERFNAIVTQTLRCFTASEPSLWSYYLPLAEFAINNSVNSSTGKSPFEIVYGFSLNFDPAVSFTHAKNHAEFTTMDWETHFQIIHNSINKSKEYVKKFADDNRILGLELQVGDYVWLNPPSSFKLGKFASRRSGPYKILKFVSPVTVKLELPAKSKASDVVHIERLEKFY